MSSKIISIADNLLFGCELPMPKVELFIAPAAVAGFLPAVVVVHHLVAFVIRRLPKVGSAHKQEYVSCITVLRSTARPGICSQIFTGGAAAPPSMISQFFILLPHEDTINFWDNPGNIPTVHVYCILRAVACIGNMLLIYEDCSVQDWTEAFFRKVRFWESGTDAPPPFQIEGVSCLRVKVRTVS